MIKQPQTIEIQLNSGLSGDTPLFIGDDLKSIRSLFLAANTSVPTFGLDDKLVPTNVEIGSIPKEMFVNELWEIRFDNGLHLTCTPNTLIYSFGYGFKPVKDIVVEESVTGVVFKDGKMQNRFFDCTHSHKSFKALKEPVYYFVSSTGTILLPHVNTESGEVSFIPIHQ